ncbi:aminoglycoside phosphotransferase family protein [Streptomyces sp. NPDC004111]|uniref:aminoglycoside phosphotransferase family protein n=1 Tax=Streptomyces sp. NPDC004111 TaxID=3364690 RepID=UPI003682FEE4
MTTDETLVPDEASVPQETLVPEETPVPEETLVPDEGLVALVRGLVRDQFPQWAGLPVVAAGAESTANAMFRLGPDLVVRLPRHEGAAQDILTERQWLPRLAPALPVPIPAPLADGEPAPGFPLPWGVYRWLDGSNPDVADGGEALAGDLAAFTSALQKIDPAGGPRSYRSETLADRDASTREAVAELAAEIDADAALRVWEDARAAADPVGPPVWIHADLQPGNVLVADGRLTAVIDFGCMGLGDRAVDLIAAWYLLAPAAHAAFREATGTGPGADEAAWRRGRGWALSVALNELRAYRTVNATMGEKARHVLAGLLASRP